ncbi:ATP synthase subunit beta, mitochondrial-like protein, partial [Tanacetum coccineum]
KFLVQEIVSQRVDWGVQLSIPFATGNWVQGFDPGKHGESKNLHNDIRKDANCTFGNFSYLVKLFLSREERVSSQSFRSALILFNVQQSLTMAMRMYMGDTKRGQQPDRKIFAADQRVQYDGRHGDDEKLITVEKREVSETKWLCPPSRSLGLLKSKPPTTDDVHITFHLSTNFDMNRYDEAISSRTLPVGGPVRTMMGRFEYVSSLIGQKEEKSRRAMDGLASASLSRGRALILGKVDDSRAILSTRDELVVVGESLIKEVVRSLLYFHLIVASFLDSQPWCIFDHFLFHGNCGDIDSESAMMNLKGYEKGEIIHSLAWQRITFAAIAETLTLLNEAAKGKRSWCRQSSTDSLDEEGKILLDPNGLSEDGTIALRVYEISHDARYLAYGVSSSGSNWLTIRVMCVDEKSVKPDGLSWVRLIPSCFAIFDLEPLSLSFDFVFTSEIFKSLSFSLVHLCRLAILCLDQHDRTLHHLESLLIISLDRLDILKEDLEYQSLWKSLSFNS